MFKRLYREYYSGSESHSHVATILAVFSGKLEMIDVQVIVKCFPGSFWKS